MTPLFETSFITRADGIHVATTYFAGDRLAETGVGRATTREDAERVAMARTFRYLATLVVEDVLPRDVYALFRQQRADPSEDAASAEPCPGCQRFYGCLCDEIAGAVDAPSEPEGSRQ